MGMVIHDAIDCEAPARVFNRVCRRCEQPFQTISPRSRYCGRDCRNRAIAEFHTGAVRKRTYRRVCAWEGCGAEFDGVRYQRYCSDQCRSKASAAVVAERRRAAPAKTDRAVFVQHNNPERAHRGIDPDAIRPLSDAEAERRGMFTEAAFRAALKREAAHLLADGRPLIDRSWRHRTVSKTIGE